LGEGENGEDKNGRGPEDMDEDEDEDVAEDGDEISQSVSKIVYLGGSDEE
jgi:hypothetical protein